MTTEQPTKKAKQQHRGVQFVLAFDVEATGMSVTEHWMPEFGAAFWKVGETKPRSQFYRLLKQPPGTTWCARTRAQFWDNPEKGVNGETPYQAFERRRAGQELHEPRAALIDFVDYAQACNREAAAEGEVMVVITDTAAFDGGVMNYNLSKFCPDKCAYMGDILGTYRPVRDISAFYFGVGKCLKKHDSRDTALLTLQGNTTLPDWVTEHAHNHNPVSDALSIAATAAYIMSMCDGEQGQD